jgi:hypothetical protein
MDYNKVPELSVPPSESGTPTATSASEYSSPLGPKGGGGEEHALAGEGVGDPGRTIGQSILYTDTLTAYYSA